MKHVALAFLLVLCFDNRSSRSLVLHRNGALVPADTPEVAAARELHLQALAAASAPEPEQGEGELSSEDVETASGKEEFLLLTEEEARRRGGFRRIGGGLGRRRGGWRG
jgi:hypothetical protein